MGYAYGVAGSNTDKKDLKELSEDIDELASGAIEQQISCLRKNKACILEL